MDLRSVNKLLAHTPWSSHEYEDALAKVRQAANHAFRAAKRKVDLLFAAASASVGLGLLRMFTNSGSEGAQLVMLVVGALVGYVALRAAYGRTSIQEAVSRWEAEEGVRPLTVAELEALRSLAAARPEALQRITAWQALGLVLRARDRRAVEDYLATQGVAVPSRHQLEHLELEPGAA